MPVELRVDLSKEFEIRIEHAARKLGAAFKIPTSDPELDHILHEEIERHADRLVDGLRQIHSKSITSYTGASYRSIRKIDAETRPGMSRGPGGEVFRAEGKLIRYAVAIGYFPSGDDSRDTANARAVQTYFGGMEGNRSIIGALLGGVEPGMIKAPVPGGAGEGVFGGAGWSRLRTYLRQKGSVRFGSATVTRKTKTETTSYKPREGKQDIWAIIRRMERRGLRRTPIPDYFYNEVVPKENRRFRASATKAIRLFWEKLGK